MTDNKIKVELLNRLDKSVIFSIDVDADLSSGGRIGVAVKAAIAAEINLSGADLRGADLRDAPVIPMIHTAVYAAASARPELFDMGTFATASGHTCGTAQCRAGWVLNVAGQAGLDLEAKIGTPAAAMAIYLASDPDRWKTERLPNFYTTNDKSLADMKRLADLETNTPPKRI